MITKKEYEENIVALDSFLEDIANKNLQGADTVKLNNIRTALVELYDKFSYLAITTPTMVYKLDTIIQKIEHELYRVYYEEES